MAIPTNPFAKVTETTVTENEPLFGEEVSETPPSIQNETQGIHMQNQGSAPFAPPSKSSFTPPKSTFAPKSGNGGMFNKPESPAQSTSGNKYNIVDLAWIVNMKVTANQRLDEGEAAILVLGFNADYNNLRVVFKSAEQSAFTASSINLDGTKIITSTNLFSETCAELLAKKGLGENVQVLERMFKTSASWTPNQTVINWEPEIVSIYSKTSSGNVSSFFLYQWQINLFEKALNFMLDQAPILHMESIFRR